MSNEHDQRVDLHFHFDAININLNGGQGPAVTLADLADIINELKDQIMATLADLQSAVAAEGTVVDSAIVLLNGLAAQVAALKPDQAAIDQLAADITAKTKVLSDAVVANTPAAP